ncbi:MAG: LysM peptidoglycan-binding domain-containing protein [Phototrophicaceae bacterium]
MQQRLHWTLGAALLLALILLPASPAQAACSAPGTPGEDTVTCTDNSAGIDLGAGDDRLVNNGTIGGIYGGDGSDSLTNNGTVTASIVGGTGDDTIINNGTIAATYGIDAGPGRNTVFHNGRADFVLAGGGGSLVIIGPNAASTSGITGAFDTTLCFSAAGAAEAIAGKSPGSGTTVINGNTYTWSGFTRLVANCTAPVSSTAGTGGRLNFDLGAPVAVYCEAGGVVVRGVDRTTGTETPLLSLSATEVREGLESARNGSENLALISSNGTAIYALRTDELQVNAIDPTPPGSLYEFIFPGDTCGTSTTTTTTTTTGTVITGSTTGTVTGTTPVGITGEGTFHTVAAGENLFRIGLRYGIHYTELGRINGIAPPYRIFVGQRIFIPAG